ncbi:MAG: hypothetical protein UHK54_05140 [Acutalibacteraceae bacterium]|nr:hypothetical protein [Acutalibacteraceae bacterium]
MKKKFLCFFLSITILFCSVSFSIQAKDETPAFEWDGHPLIFIQGYSGPKLIRDRGLETEEQVWTFDPLDVVGKVGLNLFDIIGSVADYAKGDTAPFIECFRNLTAEWFDNISMNPDGTSKYNISSYPYYIEEANVKYINEEKNGKYLPMTEGEFIEDLSRTIPEERIYIFNTDWRRSHLDNCEHLMKFIDEVLEYTGSDKVDLYGMSHGGQLVATYLYYHGTEGKVDNAVMNSPAIGGTSLVMELLGEDPVAFDLNELLRFGGVMLHTELDLRWLGNILPAEFLNSLLKTAFNEVLLPYVIRFGSIWDLMDTETYVKLRDVYLDPVENAKIIEKADKMHFECMPNMSEGLKKAQEAGVNIGILANYGSHIGTGKEVDSDFIIDTVNTSGATPATFGERFPEGYKQLNTTCTDPTHNHVSPTRTLDASTCYLPENTWFNYEQYHTQTWWDTYTRALLLELVLTDNIKDVHSDPRFPQFEIAQSPLDGVYAKYNGPQSSGYYSDSSDTITLRNLSEAAIEIQSVTINGKAVDIGGKVKLKKSGTYDLKYKPQNNEFLTVEIAYTSKGVIIESDTYTRTLYFSHA